MRHSLRVGFQGWHNANRMGLRQGVPVVVATAQVHLRRFLGLCEAARRATLSKEVRGLIVALHRCACQHRVQKEAITSRLVEWLTCRVRGQLFCGFASLHRLAQVQSASKNISAQKLGGCLEKVCLRRSVDAMAKIRRASTGSLSLEADNTSRAQALAWAAQRCRSHMLQSVQRTKQW